MLNTLAKGAQFAARGSSVEPAKSTATETATKILHKILPVGKEAATGPKFHQPMIRLAELPTTAVQNALKIQKVWSSAMSRDFDKTHGVSFNNPHATRVENLEFVAKQLPKHFPEKNYSQVLSIIHQHFPLELMEESQIKLNNASLVSTLLKMHPKDIVQKVVDSQISTTYGMDAKVLESLAQEKEKRFPNFKIIQERISQHKHLISRMDKLEKFKENFE